MRTEDNAALSAACRAGDRGVVGVFAICPQQWRDHDWGDVRVEFLLRNLACLAERLRKLRVALRIIERPLFTDVPAGLLALARQLECDALYFNREYEVNESRRDAAVGRIFESAGLTIRVFDDGVIIPPHALRRADGVYYTVFTNFKRRWLRSVEEGGYRTLPPAARAAGAGLRSRRGAGTRGRFRSGPRAA